MGYRTGGSWFSGFQYDGALIFFSWRFILEMYPVEAGAKLKRENLHTMPSKSQIPKGKTTATIVVDENLHKTVLNASSDLNTFVSDIYSQGAMTYLNNGRRPITREEQFAMKYLKNMSEEKRIMVEAMARFMDGSVSKPRLSMLKNALGKYYEQAAGREPSDKEEDITRTNLKKIA